MAAHLPALFERLSGAGRVVQISAPAGSGKTYLVRSWIEESGLADRVAWVSVGREERDAHRFWISVGDALRRTDPGAKVVRGLTAAPELDCWAVLEQLIKDIGALPERTWLVLDDLHELSSGEAMRQLELVLMRAPAHPYTAGLLASRRTIWNQRRLRGDHVGSPRAN